MKRSIPRLWPALAVGITVLSVSALALGTLLEAMHVHLKKLPIEARDGIKLHTMPTSIPITEPRWVQARPDEISSAEGVEELGTTNYLTRWYRRAGSADEGAALVQLHLAYYTGMIDTVPHVPERCFVGGGMSIDGPTRIVPLGLDLERFPVDGSVDPELHGGAIRMGRTLSHAYVRMPRELEELKINVTSFRDGSGRRLHAGYFFLANGGHVPTANDVRQLAFKLEDSYSYYAKVQVMSMQPETAEELAALAADLLNELLPDIVRRTPDWVEVVEGRYPEDASGGGDDGNQR